MQVDLSVLSPAMLDAELDRQFDGHRHAMDEHDDVERQACHLVIKAILEEQARRLDAWIATHTEVTA